MKVTNSITRQQKWDEIKSGQRKLKWLFPYSNEALLVGILSFIGILGLGIIFGIWGIYIAKKGLSDSNENKNKSYRIKAWVGMVLSICGIIFGVLINFIKPKI